MAKGHDEKIDSKVNDATGEASGPQVDTSSTQAPQTSAFKKLSLIKWTKKILTILGLIILTLRR